MWGWKIVFLYVVGRCVGYLSENNCRCLAMDAMKIFEYLKMEKVWKARKDEEEGDESGGGGKYKKREENDFHLSPFFMYLMACWLGRWCAFGQKNRNRSEIDEWTQVRVCISILLCKFFNLMFFFRSPSLVGKVCVIYMPMLFYIHALAFSLIFYYVFFYCCCFSPFHFSSVCWLLFFIIITARKILDVCVCVCSKEQGREELRVCFFLCILNNFPYFFTLFGSCLDDR